MIFWNNVDEPLPEPQIKRILWMLINAVYQCHENNIMHRDIKPSNIMFEEDGNLKLGDFGCARVAELDDELPGKLFCQ